MGATLALSLGLSGRGHKAPTTQIRYLLLDDGIYLMVQVCYWRLSDRSRNLYGGAIRNKTPLGHHWAAFATLQDGRLHVRSVELAAAVLSLLDSSV